MLLQNRFSTGYFYSTKNKRLIEIMSRLEGDYFLTLEFNEDVLEYKERPFKISAKIQNKKVSYTPSCLVLFKNPPYKKLLVEIKYRKEIFGEKREKLINKIRTCTFYSIKNDMHFRIVTEKNIDRTYLNNLKFLYRFTTEPSINGEFDKYKDQILSTVKEKKQVSINAILKKLGHSNHEKGFLLPVIWFLVSSRILKTDLNIPLTNNSTLELNNDKN